MGFLGYWYHWDVILYRWDQWGDCRLKMWYSPNQIAFITRNMMNQRKFAAHCGSLFSDEANWWNKEDDSADCAKHFWQLLFVSILIFGRATYGHGCVSSTIIYHNLYYHLLSSTIHIPFPFSACFCRVLQPSNNFQLQRQITSAGCFNEMAGLSLAEHSEELPQRAEISGFQLIKPHGGFHSHGGTPIAGWFLLGKIPSRNGWKLGLPLF